MKKLPVTLLALAANAMCVSGASATDFNLFDWATYKDGTVVTQPGSPVIPGLASIFDLIFTTAGTHTAIGFVDVEIDESINTFFNEFGETSGSLPAVQSWEIDEPEYVFGDIWTNFSSGVLDNTNAVPDTSPDDVSMALGWDFTLDPGYTAKASYFLSAAAPSSGFYLTHTDPDSDASLYFYSTLSITPNCQPGTPGCNPIPEPSMAWLFAPALAGLVWTRRRSKKAA
ncbi:MAG: PEP-CTERM sorting domain-containing protein [Rhodocyclaceae bacterium]|nr:PEP-CTERM sorting domain-containing protein [Rhodocyclaceae bacterium]